MTYLSNLWNIILSILEFVFGYASGSPMFFITGAFIVGIISLGTLRYLIKGL